MSDDNVVFPTTYKEWRHCIEVLGKISLTPTYINKRLTELQDGKHSGTREFARLYGDDHLEITIAWFRQAASELSGT
jgi:hypothetical protein